MFTKNKIPWLIFLVVIFFISILISVKSENPNWMSIYASILSTILFLFQIFKKTEEIGLIYITSRRKINADGKKIWDFPRLFIKIQNAGNQRISVTKVSGFYGSKNNEIELWDSIDGMPIESQDTSQEIKILEGKGHIERLNFLKIFLVSGKIFKVKDKAFKIRLNQLKGYLNEVGTDAD